VVLKDLVKIPAAREQKARTFLIHEITWTDVVAWSLTEAGLEITSEIVRDGYKYTTVGGYTFVTTIRDNNKLVEPGVIYVFPAPEFLGRILVLENTKFYIDKIVNLIRWQAWMDVACAIANISSVAKVELYNGQTTGATDSDDLPTESDLFKQTNPVWDGGATYPSVTLW
jgi:hypothetical protein